MLSELVGGGVTVALGAPMEKLSDPGDGVAVLGDHPPHDHEGALADLL